MSIEAFVYVVIVAVGIVAYWLGYRDGRAVSRKPPTREARHA